ncbi:unnamed protein product [Diatraea saccharalis]|uniref:Fe2OG dioxygenase domain-containing protein n=1 Tax=Diatraea saccharalis TaxID=40085 RepID=A0A9N9N1Q7_9NEOP|nr:unnamed protein product [Diatraea saccharalis]
MNSPSKENEKPTSSGTGVQDDAGVCEGESASSEAPRPPAKRPLSTAVIEISDTDSDDSDVCAVNSYQASADEVKRIRGESPWEDDSIVVDDNKVEIKPIVAQLNPRANRMDDPKLNPAIKVQETKDSLAANWKDFKDFTNNEITLTCDPFRVCLLNNFLANPEIINNIVDDMNTLDWERKKMDLYQFHQTTDLANLTWQRSIRGIYELLKTEVMSWVSEVTGIELTSVSASCSLYGPGDHLLVHDDLLADRRVAFILYLAPWAISPPAGTAGIENGSGDNHKQECGWGAHMGGALELLARGEAGPTHVARRLLPANNRLAFFKVHTDSYHQVEEVLSLELPRLSINGWFHGPAPPTPPPQPPPPPVYISPHNNPVRSYFLY